MEVPIPNETKRLPYGALRAMAPEQAAEHTQRIRRGQRERERQRAQERREAGWRPPPRPGQALSAEQRQLALQLAAELGPGMHRVETDGAYVAVRCDAMGSRVIAFAANAEELQARLARIPAGRYARGAGTALDDDAVAIGALLGR